MVESLTDGRLGALRHRPFRAYFIGQLVSLSGTWMYHVAQGWLVWEISHDESVVGMIAAAGYGGTLLFSFVGGAAADHFDRRHLMIATQVVAMLLTTGLGALCITSDPQLWQVTVIVVGLGIVHAFDLPTRHALVANLVPKTDLVNAVVLNQVLFNVARVVGPAMAGLLIARTSLGVGGVFLLNGASFVLIIAVLLTLHTKPDDHADAGESGFFEGFKFAVRARHIGGVLLLVVAAGIFGWSIPIVLPSMAENVLGGDASLFGTMMSAIGAGAIIGSLLLVWTTRVVPKLVLIPCGLAVWAAALGAFSFVEGVTPAIALLVVAGIGMINFSGASNALIQKTVPDHLRGRVMGVWGMTFGVAEPVGSLQAGALASNWGPAQAIRFAAMAMAAAGLAWATLTLAWTRRDDQ
jgi:MFS family permease